MLFLWTSVTLSLVVFGSLTTILSMKGILINLLFTKITINILCISLLLRNSSGHYQIQKENRKGENLRHSGTHCSSFFCYAFKTLVSYYFIDSSRYFSFTSFFYFFHKYFVRHTIYVMAPLLFCCLLIFLFVLFKWIHEPGGT